MYNVLLMFVEVGCISCLCLGEWMLCICSDEQYAVPLAKGL